MRKYIWITISFCWITSFAAQSQTVENILEQIEKNNTSLRALRSEADAEKIGNKTGIYLDNPEVEYSYSWGNDHAPGDKTTLSVMQSFDFPTAYYYKRKVSNNQNQQVDLRYLVERKNILLEAKRTCIELIYLNAYRSEMEVRLAHARQIAEAYQIQFELGNANILDMNKAKLNLLNVQKELNTLYAERDFVLAELTRYNGGVPVFFSATAFPPIALKESFEAYYSKSDNLDLLSYLQEAQINKESEKLQRSMNLPKLSAGYVSEKIATAEHFQGVAVGISIPLFENKNTVKQIQAQRQAIFAAEADAERQYKNEMKALYDKAVSYSRILISFDEIAIADNTAGLLKQALDLGEITLIDYLQELSIYYEVINNRLEVERDLHLAVAGLMQWKL